MIIGLVGKKQSGKSSCAMAILHELGPEMAVNIDLARDLKNLCQGLFGVRSVNLWGTEQDKNEVISHLGMTGRQLMQMMGEGMRKIDKNVWIRLWKESVCEEQARHRGRTVVTADVRYLNEMQTIMEMGGKLIKLERVPYQDGHASEVEMDQAWPTMFDLVVPATAGIDEMKAMVLEKVREWRK